MDRRIEPLKTFKPSDELLATLADIYSWNETCLFLNGRVRQLKVELGKQAAYIMELEHRLSEKDLEPVQTKSERKSISKEIRKEQLYIEINTHNKSLKDKLIKLQREKDQLIFELQKNK